MKLKSITLAALMLRPQSTRTFVSPHSSRVELPVTQPQAPRKVTRAIYSSSATLETSVARKRAEFVKEKQLISRFRLSFSTPR